MTCFNISSDELHPAAITGLLLVHMEGTNYLKATLVVADSVSAVVDLCWTSRDDDI